MRNFVVCDEQSPIRIRSIGLIKKSLLHAMVYV